MKSGSAITVAAVNKNIGGARVCMCVCVSVGRAGVECSGNVGYGISTHTSQFSSLKRCARSMYLSSNEPGKALSHKGGHKEEPIAPRCAKDQAAVIPRNFLTLGVLTTHEDNRLRHCNRGVGV